MHQTNSYFEVFHSLGLGFESRCNNSSVGPVYIELCSGFNWALASGQRDWFPRLVNPCTGYKLIKNKVLKLSRGHKLYCLSVVQSELNIQRQKIKQLQSKEKLLCNANCNQNRNKLYTHPLHFITVQNTPNSQTIKRVSLSWIQIQ